MLVTTLLWTEASWFTLETVSVELVSALVTRVSTCWTMPPPLKSRLIVTVLPSALVVVAKLSSMEVPPTP